MRKIKLKILLGLISWLVLPLMAESETPLYRAYIEQYKSIALQHQQDYHIPASITMAQGLLESGAGQSELARNANNHFGIKCTSSWTGRTYMHDDETQNECFRHYATAQESWNDHALFLQRDRYKSLFELAITDYQGWARGLQQCGYATDPKYPDKLIHLIELYHLDALTADAPATAPEPKIPTDSIVVYDTITIPETMSFQQRAQMDDVELYHNHSSGKVNGLRYIIANEGDSFATLAYYLNMQEKYLRKINDASDGRELHQGDRVFLYAKRKKADRHHARYMVKAGDTAWGIAQRFGIQMKSIYDLNGIPYNVPLVTRQELVLR